MISLRRQKKPAPIIKERIRMHGISKSGEILSYWDDAPVDELLAAYPVGARQVNFSRFRIRMWRALGMLVLGAVVPAAVYVLLPAYPVFAFMCIPVGLVPGWFIGGAIGKHFCVGSMPNITPYWMLWYEWQNGTRVVTPYEYEQMGREFVRYKKNIDAETGETLTQQVEGVYRADHWAEQEQMHNVRMKIRPVGGTLQKVAQIGSLVAIALGLMTLIFFFYAAFSGDGNVG